MKKRLLQAALILMALAMCACYPLFIEAAWLETTVTRIRIRGLTRPVRVLHLSDLHLGMKPSLEQLEQLAKKAVTHRPDLICLTGDYVDTPKVLDRAPLDRVIAILARAAPVYAIMGNHDGGAWLAEHGQPYPTHDRVRQSLERGGAIVLHNRWEQAKVAGQDLVLVGVGDLWSDETDAVAAYRNLPAGPPVILLAHNPDSKDAALAFARWDLMLAGHTHGNQVNLPFYDEPWATVRDHRFISGLHQWEGHQLYVNRGVGGAWGVRFRSRPEISILELVP
jgi:predicted MPP superfamily phosphohydrolase